ncbi:SDR family NAD(P)-dependent oxidoreductase [Arenibacterium sp. LLYu02]|uniref:SDR family NAD(P)-dependent oxidoreductase n=1 Tax=Arenibacterium sp. LLYu02 TaxID=3404132 RepID=UPI003B20E63D
MNRDFAGKTALVTGANRGIGWAIVEELAARGAQIALHARRIDAELLERTAALARQTDTVILPLSGDLGEEGAIAHIMAQLDAQVSRLDLLVNNAGFESAAALEELPLADWDAVLKVNLTAPFQLAQAACQRMKQTGGGVVINISSIHDEVPRKGFTHYSVAKAGLKMLSRCAAVEWAEYGIRVLTLSPGAIETDINREVIEEIGRDTFADWIPLGVGQPQDVAHLVAFAASDQARYMTGTELYLDGGYMRNLVRYDGRPGRG